jgi:hypothetical protein
MTNAPTKTAIISRDTAIPIGLALLIGFGTFDWGSRQIETQTETRIAIASLTSAVSELREQIKDAGQDRWTRTDQMSFWSRVVELNPTIRGPTLD